MTVAMTTARELIAALEALDPDAALGFATDTGEIGGRYHITELKLSEIRSIDCGGRESRWSEAAMQLLDGHGAGWMAAGKVVAILKRSVTGASRCRRSPADDRIRTRQRHDRSVSAGRARKPWKEGRGDLAASICGVQTGGRHRVLSAAGHIRSLLPGCVVRLRRTGLIPGPQQGPDNRDQPRFAARFRRRSRLSFDSRSKYILPFRWSIWCCTEVAQRPTKSRSSHAP